MHGKHMFLVLLKNSEFCVLFTGLASTFFNKKKTLKLGLTALFTRLKIILLYYFQFSVISGIQTELYYYTLYTQITKSAKASKNL